MAAGCRTTAAAAHPEGGMESRNVYVPRDTGVPGLLAALPAAAGRGKRRGLGNETKADALGLVSLHVLRCCPACRPIVKLQAQPGAIGTLFKNGDDGPGIKLAYNGGGRVRRTA